MKKSISLITALTVSLFSFSTMSSSDASAKANEPVEILSLRSEYGKHFDNGDGTMTSYVNTAPIHYLEDGEWIEIDNSLVIDENNNYTNVRNPLKVTIPSKLSIGDSSSIGLVSNGSSIQIPLEDVIKNVADADKESYDASVNDVSNTKIEKDLPDALLDSFNNNVSSISYNLADNCKELTLDIHPDSLVETLTFDKGATLPNTLSYPIKSDDLDIKINEDSNIAFVESDGSVAFTMIAPVIYDSSEDHNYSSIAIDIIKSDDGCYVTFSLEDAINVLNDPVYPLILSTEYTVQRSANTRYNSEYSPYENIYDQYMRIGNVDGYGFQTFVSCSDSFTGYSGNVTITDASFNMYLVGNYLSSPKTLKVYSMNTQPMNCSWNNASTLNNYNTHITDFDVAYTEMYTWKEVDITKLAQSWLNYGKTSQNVGVASYGFKIITESNPKATVVANSERASYNHPYFEINYVVDSDYALTYAPHKYNDINSGLSNIYNFQKRMNCYAYALQIYYRGLDNNCYLLYPGEIGLGLQTPSNDNITTFGQLASKYNSLSGYSLLQFTDEHMKRDAQVIGYSISNLSYGNDSCISNNDTWLYYIRNLYNPNNGRIIALVAGTHDVHYYLRHGNGSCSNPDHDSSCSLWSHKPGYTTVGSAPFNWSPTLCDETIYVYSTWASNYYSGPWFYHIDKTTNPYNAWFYNGHDTASTGTSFVYLD